MVIFIILYKTYFVLDKHIQDSNSIPKIYDIVNHLKLDRWNIPVLVHFYNDVLLK